MIAILLHALLALLSPRVGELADGVMRTAVVAPQVAGEHAMAAVIAGAVFDVDPALLLSIAHHESNYDHTATTAEAGQKTSCGVMTPVPTQDAGSCRLATSSPLAGYLVGAQHLRTWLDAQHGNLHAALVGYAGGYRLIGRCARGPVIVIRGRYRKDVCRTPEVFLGRAARIRATIAS